MWVQLNDQLVPEESALVSVFDRGFMYGDGAFETMRAYEGSVFRLQSHLERLAGSATAIGIGMPRSVEEIASDIGTVLARNKLQNATVRVRISRGKGTFPSVNDAQPTYVVAAEALPSDLEDRIQNGIRLSSVGVRKTPDSVLPSGAKHANYLNSILAVAEAEEKGADEAVMLTLDGAIAEASRANIFFVKDSALWTPSLDAGILPGITRAVVLELSETAGMVSTEATIEPDRLEAADEVFVTNSVVGILPVRQWDVRRYMVPGPQTTELINLYGECVARELRSS